MPPLPAAVAGLADPGASLAALAGGPAAGAIKAFTSGLESAGKSMEKFVGALSPGSVEIFNRALDNLHATIGAALLPAFEVLTDVITQISNIIGPAMDQLAPIIRTVAEALGGVLITAVQTLADLLVELMPVIKFLADVFKIMTQTVSILIKFWQALFSTLFGGAIGEMEDTFTALKNAIEEIILVIMVGVAKLVKAFGGAEVLEKWRAALSAGPATTGGKVAAPKDVAVRALPDIAQQMATSAFAAGGGAKVDPLVSLQTRMAEQLELIAKGEQDLFDDFWEKMTDAIYNAISKKAANIAAETVQESIVERGNRWNKRLGLEGVADWIQRTIDE